MNHMIGAEITLEGRSPVTVAADNAYIFIFCGGKADDSLTAGGSNVTEFLRWFDFRKLHVGDKIKIRIVETEQASPPLQTKPQSREQIKQRYEELRAELKAKGLIK